MPTLEEHQAAQDQVTSSAPPDHYNFIRIIYTLLCMHMYYVLGKAVDLYIMFESFSLYIVEMQSGKVLASFPGHMGAWE